MVQTVKELQFKILIEQDEDGLFVASVPELPSCYTQGKTLEEVRKRIREVIKLILETNQNLRKEKEKAPASSHRFFGIEDITIKYA